MSRETNVMESLYKLMRNIRRQPSRKKYPARAYLRILRALSDKDDQSSKELAEAVGIRPPSLSEALTKMEADQTILRSQDPHDLRVTRVSLTEKGKEVYEEHKHEKRVEEDRIESWLTSEEKEIFCHICHKLNTKLEEAAKDKEHFDHKKHKHKGSQDL